MFPALCQFYEMTVGSPRLKNLSGLLNTKRFVSYQWLVSLQQCFLTFQTNSSLSFNLLSTFFTQNHKQ
jgi:hypothetical protein